MSRKTCTLALMVLTLALTLVPGVYAKNPIDNIEVIQDLPDTMIAGNSYEVIITFDNVAKESVPLIVEIKVTSEEPIGYDEIFVDEILLNGFDLMPDEVAPGVFKTTEEGTVGANSQNELNIIIYTAINLMPGTYNFDIELSGEELPNKPPVAVVSATVDYLTVTFDGSSSYDQDGYIDSYVWDFGDEESGAGETVDHEYSVEGTYTVTLTVIDDEGLEDSYSFTVKVTRRKIVILGRPNANPKANAGKNQKAFVGEYVKFSGVNSTDPDGTIVSYGWDFGDGAEASGVNVSHRYLMEDNYTVTLTVVDDRYGEDTDTCTITVVEHAITPPPLPPYLDNLNVTPAVIELGGNVTISFDLRNFDSQHITYGVDIYVEDVNVTRIWVDLGGYEFKTVSHTITPDTVGIYSVAVHGMTGSFTVEAPEIPLRPAEFVVSDLSITPEEVEPGDEVTISVLVTNIGEETGDYTVTLDVPAGPFLRIQETVSLEGGESERVEFEVSRDIEGIYDVTVDWLTGSFTVESPPRPAEFEFSDLRIFYPGVITPEVEEGETVTVAVSLEAENVGELQGGRTVELKVNGSAVDSQEVTLEGGASVTVLFELERGEGTYQVEVEGMTDTFTVVAEIPTGISVGYFAGVIIVIVSLGVIIFLIRKGKLADMFAEPE